MLLLLDDRQCREGVSNAPEAYVHGSCRHEQACDIFPHCSMNTCYCMMPADSLCVTG